MYTSNQAKDSVVGRGQAMITLVWRVIRDSPIALTTREVCVAVNGVSKTYCQNVDGRGGHCRWAFSRSDAELTYHLVVPPCRYRFTDVIRTIKLLAERGDIKRAKVLMRDHESKWGYEYYKLNYTREEQLYARLGRKPLA